jgi:hypothetical protein
MGSLFSTSTPSYTPVAYTPASSTTPSSTQTVTNRDDEDETTNETSNDEGDIRDLVRQSARSRSATIQTSYRGVLDENAESLTSLSPQRKSLLGE